ncbi:hypothetical protein [Abyssisolibacter fermentans]
MNNMGIYIYYTSYNTIRTNKKTLNSTKLLIYLIFTP